MALRGLFISIYFFALILFPIRPFHEFPEGVHLWAQVDYLSIINGFESNGHDLLSPQSYVLNPEFPNNGMKPYSVSTTSGDLQLHPWIISFFIEDAQKDIEWIRLYYSVLSFLFLVAVFLIGEVIIGHVLGGFLVALFFMITPLFQYYSLAVLPGIGALLFSTIGLLGYLYYLKKTKGFYLSLAFLLIGALMRSTFYMWFFGVLITEYYFKVRSRKFERKDWIFSFSSIMVILFHLIVLKGTDEQHGSIFLSKLMPFETLVEWKDGLRFLKENNASIYFSSFQWIVLGVTFILFLIKLKKCFSDKILFLSLLFFLFACLFFVAMGRQFIYHDYYFLEALFLPLILIMIQGLSFLFSKQKKSVWLLGIILIISLIPSLNQARHIASERSRSNESNRIYKTLKSYQGLDNFLDSLGYSDEEVLFIPDATAPNLPLFLADRNGYANMTTSANRLTAMLEWPWDLMCVQREYLVSDIYSEIPAFFDSLELSHDYNGLLIFSRSESSKTLPELLHLGFKWQWINKIDTTVFEFNGDALYLNTVEVPLADCRRFTAGILVLEGDYFAESQDDLLLVVSGHLGEQQLFYSSNSLRSIVGQKQGRWNSFYYEIDISHLLTADYLKCYLYNPNSISGKIRKFRISLGGKELPQVS